MNNVEGCGRVGAISIVTSGSNEIIHIKYLEQYSYVGIIVMNKYCLLVYVVN